MSVCRATALLYRLLTPPPVYFEPCEQPQPPLGSPPARANLPFHSLYDAAAFSNLSSPLFRVVGEHARPSLTSVSFAPLLFTLSPSIVSRSRADSLVRRVQRERGGRQAPSPFAQGELARPRGCFGSRWGKNETRVCAEDPHRPDDQATPGSTPRANIVCSPFLASLFDSLSRSPIEYPTYHWPSSTRLLTHANPNASFSHVS